MSIGESRSCKVYGETRFLVNPIPQSGKGIPCVSKISSSAFVRAQDYRCHNDVSTIVEEHSFRGCGETRFLVIPIPQSGRGIPFVSKISASAFVRAQDYRCHNDV